MGDEWDIVQQSKVIVPKGTHSEVSTEWTPVKRSKAPVGGDVDPYRVGVEVGGGAIGGAIGAVGGLATPIPGDEYFTTILGEAVGSATATAIYDTIRMLKGDKEDPGILQSTMTFADDFLMNAILPPGLAKVTDIAKGPLKSMSATFRGRKGGRSSLELMDRFKIRPMAGAATGARGTQQVEKTLGDFPFSSGVMQEAGQEVVMGLETAVNKIMHQFGLPKSAEELGTMMKNATPEMVAKLDSTVGKLEDRVTAMIGSDTPLAMNNTMNEIQGIIKKGRSGPDSSINKFLEDYAEKSGADLNLGISGELPYESVRHWRSWIGEMLKDPNLVGGRNISRSDLKKIYKGLSQDIEAAIEPMGKPALGRWKAANKYRSVAQNRQIEIIDTLQKKKWDEDVYMAVFGKAKAGAGRIRAIKRQLTVDQWNTVSATVLENMGKAVPHAQAGDGARFSIGTFVTRWNTLSKSAKDALFGRSNNQGLRHELDNLANLIGDFKDVEKMANNSKSGAAIALWSLIGGGAGMVATGSPLQAAKMVGASAVTSYSLAKLMTNRRFVRWLAKGVKIGKTDPNAISVHLGRLAVLSQEPKLKGHIENLSEFLINEVKE